jgi:hypothetical protein
LRAASALFLKATMLLKHLFFAVVLKLALANNNNNNNQLALNPNNVQTGSQSDGLGNGAQPGQIASATCVSLYWYS